MAGKQAKKPVKVPKKRRSTGRRPGNPGADPAKIARGLELLAACDPEAAVRESGVHLATLYRHRDRRAAASPPPSPSPAPIARPSPPGAPALGLHEQAREEGRRQVRALDDRILAARNPGAGRELADGRLVATQGEAALAPWLARPLPAAEIQRDTLSVAWDLLAKLTGIFDTLQPHQRGPLAEKMLGAVNRIEQIERGRPREEKPDEVVRRIAAIADQARARALPKIREASARLVAERDALAADVLAGKLAPVDVVARVDAMLGGA